ncbi:MAG: hypothetical protein WA988_16455 [Candidatus Nanopelagicales bacterium]
MSVLAWWLLPILATLGAILWLCWQSRTGAGEPGQTRSTKELDRMRKAMEKPLPAKASSALPKALDEPVDPAAAADSSTVPSDTANPSSQ